MLILVSNLSVSTGSAASDTHHHASMPTPKHSSHHRPPLESLKQKVKVSDGRSKNQQSVVLAVTTSKPCTPSYFPNQKSFQSDDSSANVGFSVPHFMNAVASTPSIGSGSLVSSSADRPVQLLSCGCVGAGGGAVKTPPANRKGSMVTLSACVGRLLLASVRRVEVLCSCGNIGAGKYPFPHPGLAH